MTSVFLGFRVGVVTIVLLATAMPLRHAHAYDMGTLGSTFSNESSTNIVVAQQVECEDLDWSFDNLGTIFDHLEKKAMCELEDVARDTIEQGKSELTGAAIVLAKKVASSALDAVGLGIVNSFLGWVLPGGGDPLAGIEEVVSDAIDERIDVLERNQFEEAKGTYFLLFDEYLTSRNSSEWFELVERYLADETLMESEQQDVENTRDELRDIGLESARLRNDQLFQDEEAFELGEVYLLIGSQTLNVWKDQDHLSATEQHLNNTENILRQLSQIHQTYLRWIIPMVRVVDLQPFTHVTPAFCDAQAFPESCDADYNRGRKEHQYYYSLPQHQHLADLRFREVSLRTDLWRDPEDAYVARDHYISDYYHTRIEDFFGSGYDEIQKYWSEVGGIDPNEYSRCADWVALDLPIDFCTTCYGTIFVDPEHKGFKWGTERQPYGTLADALSFSCGGGTLAIASGNYTDSLRIDSDITLVASDGTVVIGE